MGLKCVPPCENAAPVEFFLSDSYAADVAAAGHLAFLGDLIWHLVRNKSSRLTEAVKLWCNF